MPEARPYRVYGPPAPVSTERLPPEPRSQDLPHQQLPGHLGAPCAKIIQRSKVPNWHMLHWITLHKRSREAQPNWQLCHATWRNWRR